MRKILIINGPNLNLLGKREPEIYGTKTFDDYLVELKSTFKEADLHYFQSNIEGELVNAIQQSVGKYDGVVLNAGGYTHTSVALADAIGGCHINVVEVHISNPAAREPFRHTSYLAKSVAGSIAGFGLSSYDLAIKWILES